MSIDALLLELRERGVQVWTENGELRYRAPQGRFDAELKGRVVAAKTAIIRALDALQSGTDAGGPLVQVQRGDVLPLSHAQERLLFMRTLGGNEAAYNIPVAFRVRGPLDADRLQRAVDALVRRHEVLQTRYADGADVAGASWVDMPVRIEQRQVAAQGPDLDALLVLEAGRGFDLAEAAPLRVTLVRLDDGDHVLLIVLHHIAADGWSLDVLKRDLGALYAGVTLPALPVQYADHAAWQRSWLQSSGQRIQAQQAYWRQQLAGAPVLSTLPGDRPRPAMQRYHGAVLRRALPDAALQALQTLARDHGVTSFVAGLAVFNLLMWRHTGSTDLVVGTPVANRVRAEVTDLVGFFSNTLVMRTRLQPGERFQDLLDNVRETVLAAQENQDIPFEQVVEYLQPPRSLSHTPLFQLMFSMIERGTDGLLLSGCTVEQIAADTHVAKYDLTLTIEHGPGGAEMGLEYNTDLFDADTVDALASQFTALLEQVGAGPTRRLPQFRLPAEAVETTAAGTAADMRSVACRFRDVAQRDPDAVALRCGDLSLDFRTLQAQVAALSARLRSRGVGPEQRVGVLLERSPAMVVALLAVLDAGAAYVPIDPDYPVARQALMIEDAGLSLLISAPPLRAIAEVAGAGVPVEMLDAGDPPLHPAVDAVAPPPPDALAYMIYTSGSTGRPKGVMVSHANLCGFLHSLDQRLQPGRTGRQVWLAVTSVSFDISVLELLWTLSRGHQVVLQQEQPAATAAAALASAGGAQRRPAAPLGFSLFYFAAERSAPGADRYRLLMDGARFADESGFEAVWVPERHFHAFGGQYPSPAVAAAALAAVTRNVCIRAGSVVLPLHHPVRVAEEWSMIDHLSKGRAGIAFASGWHFNDFVFNPDNYAERHQVLRDGVETVRALWRGESRPFRAGNGSEVEIRTRPEPVQPELPVWITAAGSPETFEYAGRIGANVLTHLLGQSLEELAGKIALYRRTRAEHGHDPEAGRVTLMLHTYVGEDSAEVSARVEAPFKDYLRSSVNLLRPVAEANGLDPDVDQEVLVEAGFQRYARSSALFGTPEECLPMIGQLQGIGVDEAACLVDFGIEEDQVVDGFAHLKRLRQLADAEHARQQMLTRRTYHPAEEAITRHAVTHLQCTPSFMRLLLDSEPGRQAVAGLDAVLVGGEALPAPLAQQLAATARSAWNMYGPTETTVWSGATQVTEAAPTLGGALGGEQIRVLDLDLEQVPSGVAGELYIGGIGVTRGYWQRPALTAERFLPDPLSRVPGARMYRTGDGARGRRDGAIDFLGRLDQQTKWRGFRIELGEIEAALEGDPAVTQAVAVVRHDTGAPPRLVAYVVATGMAQGSAVQDMLRARLQRMLPDYMQPDLLLVLPHMPLTPNGKVNRAALPVPDATQLPTREDEPPATDTERAVAQIWSSLLGVESIGRHANFFELGGHSFLLAQMHARLRGMGRRELNVVDLFRNPTIAGLGDLLDAEQDEDGSVRAALIATRSRERGQAAQRQRQQLKERLRNG
ncbi:MupA/Atu3671 family FMN-dependent luciferase-like monooxygenase [Stenotrophomonas sp. LGBM10]|uniref:MupA/Atu3671 family FMN-dependent luciferase-like monooxygenase n=1 Tax=Stenotrophomonas sp. LGBM10 TaxID=3390038 RepID=UPI00398BAA1F